MVQVGRQQQVTVSLDLRAAAGVTDDQAAAAGVPAQQQGRVRVLKAQTGQKIIQVIFQLAKVVHVAPARRRPAVAAQIRSVDMGQAGAGHGPGQGAR